jgi:hypothetical protein
MVQRADEFFHERPRPDRNAPRLLISTKLSDAEPAGLHPEETFMPILALRVASRLARRLLRSVLHVLVTTLIFAVCFAVALRLLGVPVPGPAELLEKFEGVSRLAEILS